MDIYAHEDYRAFLKAAFEERKKADPKYSHRKLAAAAGFSNPGFFNDVVKGRRSLSPEATAKMAAAFDLKGSEAEYFGLLVDYGQSKKPEERQELYRQMIYRRNRSAFVRMSPQNSRYYQDYLYPLMRSAAQAFDFAGNYEELARFLRPPIAPAAAKKYVRDLCEWNLLKTDAEGHYHASDRLYEPAPEMKDLVRRLNRQWLQHAAEALDRIPADERHISCRLLAISGKAQAKIEERLQAFLAEVYEIFKEDSEPDRVVQVGVQLFPRTSVRKPPRRRNEEPR